MIRKSMGAIIKDVSKLASDKDKIAFLKANCNQRQFRIIFWLWISDKVSFNLPEGKPPYEHDDHGYDQGAEEEILYMEARKLINVTNLGVMKHQHKIKREQWFITLLKDVHPDDADLLCWVKDKSYPEGLDKKLIEKAFPSLKNMDYNSIC